MSFLFQLWPEEHKIHNVFNSNKTIQSNDPAPATLEVGTPARKLQRNKAFLVYLRKKAPPRALVARYKLLAVAHGVVISQPHPKSRLQDLASNYVITVLALGAKSLS